MTLAVFLSSVLLAGCAPNPLIADAPNTRPAGSVAADLQVASPTGMGRLAHLITPYRTDIQQGNFVSMEMMTRLKENMRRPEGVTREQVRFALGTPLLTDIFHADRWDYVFQLKKANGDILTSRIQLYFKDTRLVRIEGGSLPSEKEYLDLIGPGTASESAPPATAPARGGHAH